MNEQNVIDVIDSEQIEPTAQTQIALPQRHGSLPAPIGKAAFVKEIEARHNLFLVMQERNKYTSGNKKGQPLSYEDGALLWTIPGTSRPMCTKAGIEFIAAYWQLRLVPLRYEEKELPPVILPDGTQISGHIEIKSLLAVLNPSSEIVTTVTGRASTMESKYRYRGMGYICPECGKDTLMKSKHEYGGGFYCNPKKGGCGKSFKKGTDECIEIEGQVGGQIENLNPADLHHTISRMADARAARGLIGLTGMTQYLADLDDDVIEIEPEPENKKQKAEPKPVDKRTLILKNLAVKAFKGNVEEAKGYLESNGASNIPSLSDEIYDRLCADLESRIEK